MNKITIALTRYKEPDWLVDQTLESLSKQKDVSAEVLFLDQFYHEETEKFCNQQTSEDIRFRYVKIQDRGLSYARNYAVQMCSTDSLLFIDSDAIADANWAKQLSTTLSRNNVAIAGGKIIPKWHERPLLITKARVVSEQYSLLDLGNGEFEFTKVVGANFGLNRRILADEAYFDEMLGRREGILLGGEETDLCVRALKKRLKIYYNGNAIVHHQILPNRINYRWVYERIYYAGVSRAIRGGFPGTTHQTLFTDYMVLPLILPAYFIGYLHGSLKFKK